MSIEDVFISYDSSVYQRGFASLLSLGIEVTFLGIIFGWFYNSLEVILVTYINAVILIAVSFLFIIK
jgi:hypothetical protein